MKLDITCQIKRKFGLEFFICNARYGSWKKEHDLWTKKFSDIKKYNENVQCHKLVVICIALCSIDLLVLDALQ